MSELAIPEPMARLYPARPVDMVALATEQANVLAKVIEDKSLYTVIGKKKHVSVEGWTTLGAMLGVFPIVMWTKDSEDFQPCVTTTTWEQKGNRKIKHVEVKQEGRGSILARVEARNLEGQIVGAAEAECSYGEESWSNRDAYALRSMAQTRATSKALRLPLGFVMVLAGFEATPSEELPTKAINDAKRMLLRLYDGDKVAAADMWTKVLDTVGVVEADLRNEHIDVIADAISTIADQKEVIDVAATD